MTLRATRRAGASSPELLAAKARNFAFVSCDIFDTAIRRTLARPADLFLAAGARARAAGLIICTPEAFAVYRQTAENTTRAQAEADGHDEVRLHEIYRWLHENGLVTDAARAARIEFEAECAVCQSIPEIQRLHAARGDTVWVFASDTVLPADWLAELLERCGYGATPRVFASSDLRRGKHTGRLFPALVAALGCPPGEILHIGDNPLSDVAHACTHGLATYHLPRPRLGPEAHAGQHFVVRLAESRRRAPMTQPQPGPQADGAALADYAAPLLIGFSLFILAEASRRGIRRIYFFARDGYLPLAITRRLLARRGESDRFDLTYLHISRLAATDAARDYLAQTGFLAAGPRLIVDLGWHGSIQTALAAVTGLPAHDIVGCYLGLWASALRPGLDPRNAAGYLFAFGTPAPIAAMVREAYILFELIFSAPHGTVLGYASSSAGIHEPVHAVEEAPAGPTRHAAFSALETACLATFDALDTILDGAWPAEIDPICALAPMQALMTRPTRAQLAQINRVPFIHQADGGKLRAAVNHLPLHEAVLWPHRSLQRLADAPWRAGAVRDALPWPLPFMAYAVLHDRAKRALRTIARLRILPRRHGPE